MFKTDNEIWEAVKKLKGKTIKTLTRDQPNHIIDVQDNSGLFDEVRIAGRNTSPTRNDIVEAYKTLVYNGELDRKTDLSHLAGVNSQKSSIVFAIIYYIAKEDIELIQRERRLIIALRK